MSAFDLLKEEIESDIISVKINSIYRLPVVIAIEGSKSGFKNELVNFLKDKVIPDTSDEVKYAVALQLKDKIVYNCLAEKTFELLEDLCTEDETVVREAAVKSIINISNYETKSLDQTIPPICLRLAQKNLFQAKVSAIHIISATILKSGSFEKELRNQLIKLSEDETPMIRRAIAKVLGDLIDVYDLKQYTENLLEVFEKYCGDDMESVKILCMDVLIKMARKIGTPDAKKYPKEVETIKDKIIKMTIKFKDDKAWRVKQSIAQKLPELCGVFALSSSSDILSNLKALIKDPETEVKVAAINALTEFLRPFEPKIITEDSVKKDVDKNLTPGKKCSNLLERLDNDNSLTSLINDMQEQQQLVKIGLAE